MGKFILSSSLYNNVEELKLFSEEQGFRLNKAINDNSICGLWYYKKKINIDNTYIEGEDYCCCVGGLIYNNKTGNEALHDIYHNFSGDIDAIRKEILGNYCLVVRKNSKLYVFVDKYHVYQVYYSYEGDNIIISSDIIDICRYNKSIDVSSEDLLLAAFQCSPVGADTFVHGVKRLLGREYIIFDCLSGNSDIRKIPYCRDHHSYNSIEDATQNISQALESQFKKVKNVFGNEVAINMTGGLDSRVVLGACMSADIKPTLIHAQSNCQSVVGTEKGDEDCVKSISQKYNLDFKPLNWDVDYPADFKNWNELFKQYGFEFIFYGGNPNFFKSYEDITNYPHFMDTGLYGECLRIREQFNTRQEPFEDIEAYFYDYQLVGTNSSYLINKDFCIDSDKVCNHFIKRFKEEMKEFGFDPNGCITMDSFEEVRYIHCRLGNGILVNFLNRYTTCISIISTEQVCEFIYDALATYRAFGRLQLKVIESLEPSLLNTPFFSHCRECVVDKEKYILKGKYSFNEKCGKVMRSLGLKNTAFYNIARVIKNKIKRNDWRVQRNLKSNDETKQILPAIIDSIRADQNIVGEFVDLKYTPADDSLVHLIYYAMYLRGISILKMQVENDG